MSAISNLPPGVNATAFDEVVTDRSRHNEALNTATHTLLCPSCARRRNDDCPECFGTSLLPATQDQWEMNEMEEVAEDLREFCLERLEKVKRWASLASDMRTLHRLMTHELQQARTAAAGRIPA